MKKAILIVSVIALVIACNSNGNEQTTEKANNSEVKMSAEEERGLELITQNNCLQCHKVSETLVGPAYEAIAEKYKNDPGVVDTLAQRIMDGSQGIWGGVPMIPQPNLSKEDARTMVKYVLSLKK